MWFYAFSLMVNFCLVTVSVNGQNAEKKPLILVRKEGQESFVFPTYANYDNTTKTFTYQSAPSETVRYFCPAETEEQKTTIEGSDDLQYCLFGSDTPTDLCNQELKPFIRKAFDENEERSEIECSIRNDKGLLYNFGYQLCQSQAPEEVKSINSIKTNFITIYNFCHRSMQTLYIQYEIFSPNLLKNEMLLDANNLWFQDNSTNGYGLFDEYQDFMWKQAHMQILHLNFEEKSDTQPVFKGALASPFNMAFNAWRIPFFHSANVVLIYNRFFTIWKSIEVYISEAATRLLGQITIYSGIYPSVPTIVTDPNIQPFKEVQKEIPSILWRLIYNKEKNAAIAIIVHNLSADQQPGIKLCEKSICVENNWDFFNIAEGYVYCCKAEVITKLLAIQDVEMDLKLDEEMFTNIDEAALNELISNDEISV